MANEERIIPAKVNLDLAPEYFVPEYALFIKNLTPYVGATDRIDNINQGKNALKQKPLQANEIYFNLKLGLGENIVIGSLSSKETQQVILWVWNSLNNHSIVRINGSNRTAQIVYQGACLNFQLKPQYFIHEAGARIEKIYITDPVTEEKKERLMLFWTDGYNPQGSLCIEDSISTNSFDENLNPYFVGNYDKCHLIHWSVSTPLDCIKIEELVNDEPELPNYLRYYTWQFRVTFIDVYGRPSEHGIISDLYISGKGDCISSSDALARCLNLTFKAGNPLVNKIQIEFRNCNETQWYLDTVLNLYEGNNFGKWWKRIRNKDLIYNPFTNEITYKFCKTKQCNAIPQTETNRTLNPLPNVSQTLEKIGNTLGLGNNEYGFSPFSDELKSKLSLEVTTPSTTNSTTQLRTIEVWFTVYNTFINKQMPIWVLNDGQSVFGGVIHAPFPSNLPPTVPYYRNEIFSGYEQGFLNPSQRGFIGYLEPTGETPISAISEQYYRENGNLIKLDDYSNFDYTKTYFQKLTFNNLPPATYILRFASHRTNLDNINFKKTSTYVYGSYSFDPQNKVVNYQNRLDNNKELIIDVCESSYSTLNDNKIISIADLTTPSGEETQSVDGYLFEKRINGVDILPIEQAKLLLTKINGKPLVSSEFTDHNGFYFASSTRDNFYINLYGYCNCNYFLLAEDEQGKLNRVYHSSFTLTPSISTDGGYAYCPSFGDSICSRVQIKGRVVLCGTDIGIGGVNVVYSKGYSTTTDTNGEYTIIAHDNVINGFRNDTLFFFSNKCNIKDCSQGCIGSINVSFGNCVTCNERIINVTDLQVSFNSSSSLLSGGNYGIGVIGHDWLGRHGFVQTKDPFYITLPTITEKQSLSPSTITLNIDPDAVFDDWIDKLTFAITEELGYSDYQSWVTDKIEFIDNTGNVNNLAPTQIRIYYGSLLEFAKQNNYNTTSNWQFQYQDASNNNINYISDEVQFYINGDGTYFQKHISARIKYDLEGKYFLIDYDADLKDLKSGGLIRLVRPKPNAVRNVFFELCGSIKIIDGKPEFYSIELNAFDTYYLNRQIPIPITNGSTTINQLHIYGFAFEHHSVSDLWGDHCKNIGRVFTSNPYENVIYQPNEVALSGAISINGQLNYLNYFDDNKKKTFQIADNSGISAMFFETGRLLIITQFDNALAGYNDNLVRVNNNGTVQTPSAENLFGNPERKIGNNFGCLLIDKNSIRKRDGLIMFVDRSRAELLQSNFSDIQSFTKDKCDGYFRSKIKSIQKNSRRYFVGGINPVTNEYLLTDFSLEDRSYINKQRDYNIDVNETLSFDIATKHLRGWFSFTPEYYSYLDGDILNSQLFSFKKGAIYSHYNVNQKQTYNTFYGEVCERIFRIVSNKDPFIKKRPLWIEVYGNSYFIDLVKNDSNQQSRILLKDFDKRDKFWTAAFLCDTSTISDINIPSTSNINKIKEGTPLYGGYVDVRLVGNPKDNDKYTEFLGVIVKFYNQTPTG